MPPRRAHLEEEIHWHPRYGHVALAGIARVHSKHASEQFPSLEPLLQLVVGKVVREAQLRPHKTRQQLRGTPRAALSVLPPVSRPTAHLALQPVQHMMVRRDRLLQAIS